MTQGDGKSHPETLRKLKVVETNGKTQAFDPAGKRSRLLEH